MSTQVDTTEPRSLPPDDAIDVAVVGAGPTGLMIANLLGLHGLRVRVIEAGPALIDFPRGVGMDDETLRTFQTAGLVERVLPHTIPHQLLVFVDAKQRDLARLAPPQADFGWPRRNGFVQPLADRVLLDGLARFDDVEIQFSSRVTDVAQDADGVSLTIETPDGEQTLRAAFAVGADGGSSATRKALGLGFEGTSSAANWFVIDVRNDPLGRPGAYVCCDPRRPYVSISIPHGIRRFEFMLKAGETEADAMTDEFLARLLEPIVPASAKVDIIRRRVYTHHSRLAEHFRSGRVFLIGDAAHLMPVWQGQGYNSGIRDALNLSWKIAMVHRGLAADHVLDTYESERHDHAKAMIDLSTRVGKAVSVTNRFGALARDLFFRSLSAIPKAKTYIVTMKFKPMPTMRDGALTRVGSVSEPSPVGRLFIQPTVSTRAVPSTKLDDALGPWFALIAWNNDPRQILDDDAQRRLARSGVRVVEARPATQLHWNATALDGTVPDAAAPDDSVLVVGDLDGSLKRWFDAHPESVLLVRPDRIVGGASPAHAASEMVRAFDAAVGAPDPRPATVAGTAVAGNAVGGNA
ncbi:bifunctional 3-(3-hydroxy-phenyl)propionate/3-hydroxycinnamic acid hydroxylase [Frankia sp. AgB1.9]|uniref:bifunctional 3-(3-hydroxy-phenyl)propionate/3-hydroxycinnamic acid hydroxylase n=1 Tax=unclassified Frankia TaxID=2632575 RepID=UPI001932DD6C|nr:MULTISPECIES: bifunctional 3-(3-hydroxy-phenyl)propionate/3-hydroxycinnamic acid hydroxylase [unclassified Frankia]MBL7493966.1 bifunctional 3-(3-hydroxy-phenyl)propionate/3-hydroxycinnamic acid hydroxylase [Frankia sp. AgW1.1]MBL7553974.1 bifunctional 3-(3-hydroxy-phenyl)propionate/3-hydroxycinnamic acid hydroxylase [Frankia sp. AgB1.9]MBL7618118.1 bifunctional 3-(3-hydroxy-phenyl)propionate/3-hydroxycinnamic acid hydroxylase [Frankia sp. AgB1.8]